MSGENTTPKTQPPQAEPVKEQQTQPSKSFEFKEETLKRGTTPGELRKGNASNE